MRLKMGYPQPADELEILRIARTSYDAIKLNAVITRADVLRLQDRAEYWRVAAHKIREETLERAWNAERNSFAESLGGVDVDASLLLLAEVGFVKATDPRFIGTVAAIEKQLRRGQNIFR